MLKGAVMPKVAHHFQQLFQQGTGLRVEQVVGLAALVVFPWGSIGVLVAQIDLAGGGLEKGLELANSLDGIYACFIDEDYNVYYSDGMEDFIIKQ